MRSPYALDEQETVINLFPRVVSDKAEIYTCIPAAMERIKKLYTEYPDSVALVEKDESIRATVPLDWIRIAPKRKSSMTEEQRQAAAERLASYRKAKGARS